MLPLVMLSHKAGQAAVHKGAEDHAGLQPVFHVLRIVKQAVSVQNLLEMGHVERPDVGLHRQGHAPEIGRLPAGAGLLQIHGLFHGGSLLAAQDVHRVPAGDGLQQMQGGVGVCGGHHGQGGP